MTLVIIMVLIVFIISFVTMTPFLDFVYYSVTAGTSTSSARG